MALSATFQADFTSFLDAVDKADVKLKTFQDDAGKVESALTRMSNSLSGTKVIQDAALMVEAVERVGGVSKLTEAELARVSRTASEAAEKLKALGQDVPIGIQKLADASKGAADQSAGMAAGFDLSWNSLTRFAGALGIGFGIAQLVSFGKSVFESASNISDLSSKLGTSAEFVQRMSFAASQTGTTIDTVGGAIAKMNATLSAGETSTIEVLKKAGLSFDAIRAMRPEQAFLAIAAGIKEIPDPMLQAEAAVRLFGKSGQELLPAIKQGIKEIGDQTDVMSDTTVNKLDAAGDAWDKYGGKIKNVAGEFVLGPLISGLGLVLDIGTQIAHLDVMGLVQAMAGLGPEFEDVKNNGRSVAGAIDAISGSLAVAHPRIVDLGTGLRDVNEVLAEFDHQNREAAAEINRSIAAYDAHNAAVKSLADQWTGAKLAERVALYTEALKLAGGASKLSAFEMDALGKQLEEFARQGASLTPVLSNLMLSQMDFNVAVDTSGQSLKRVLESTRIHGLELLKLPPIMTDVVLKSEAVAEATDEITKSTTRAAAATLSWSEAMDLVNKGLGTMTGTVPANRDFSEENRQHIDQAYQEHRYFGPVKNGAPDYEALGFQARAMGGPVDAGSSYLVGERGPELFTPRVSGNISPSGSGQRITIPVTVNVQGSILGTMDELGRVVSTAVAQIFADQGLAT